MNQLLSKTIFHSIIWSPLSRKDLFSSLPSEPNLVWTKGENKKFKTRNNNKKGMTNRDNKQIFSARVLTSLFFPKRIVSINTTPPTKPESQAPREKVKNNPVKIIRLPKIIKRRTLELR